MTVSYRQRLRLLNRDVRLYLATAALVGFASDGMRGVLANLYLLRLGYGASWVGIFNAVGALTFGLLSLPASALGRRLGSRDSMVIGLGLMAAGNAGIPFAEAFPLPWRTVWLLSTSFVANSGVALFYVSNMPFLAGATHLEERSHAFSVEMAVVPLAAFFGALIGGMLPGLAAQVLGVSAESPEAFRWPLWIAAGIMVPGMLILRRASGVPLPPAPGEPVSAGGPAPYRLIVVMVLVAMLRFAGRGVTATFFNVYMDQALGAPTAVIGAWAAAALLLAAPVALLAPQVVAKWGNSTAIVAGALGMAVFVLPLALIPTTTAAGIGYVVSSALFYLTTGPIRAFSQEVVAPIWRPTMSGALVTGVGLSLATVAVVGGVAIQAVGFSSVFLAGAAMTATGGGAFWAWFRPSRLAKMYRG